MIKIFDLSEYQDLFTEEEVEEMTSTTYNTDTDADKMVEKVKDLQEEKERLSEIYKERIEEIKYNFENKINKIDKQINWHVFNLGNYAKQSDNLKETKTQRKLPMVSGDIIIKKSMPKMIEPDLDEEIIKEKFADYKKEKVELNWKDFKKNLIEKQVGDKWVYTLSLHDALPI